MRNSKLRLWLAVLVLAAVCLVPAESAQIGGDDFLISTSSGREPDAAYGAKQDRYLVVWKDSPTGRIAARWVTRDGATSGGAFYVSDAGPVEAPYFGYYPSVAYNETDDEFLVVWEQEQRPGAAWGQRVSAVTGNSVGSNFSIGTVGKAARPGVAWSKASNRYLVVYWSNLNIYCDLISSTGAPFVSDIRMEVIVGPEFTAYPSVTWGDCGSQDVFLVTYDYAPNSMLDPGWIHARRVSGATGAMLGGVIKVSVNDREGRSNAAYDPTSNRWLVQYNEGCFYGSGYSSDQFGRFVNCDGSPAGSEVPIAHTPAFEGESNLGGDIAFVPAMGRYASVFQYELGAVVGLGMQETYASGELVGPVAMLSTRGCYMHTNAADMELGRLLAAFESLEGGSFYIRGQVYELDTDVTSATPDGAYPTASTIDIQVAFARKAFVTGTPLLHLETGTNDRDAVYLTGSGTNTLTFRYTVVEGDAATDLDYKSSAALVLNGGTIVDDLGGAINLTLPAPGAPRSLAYHEQIVIDTQNATVTNVTSTKADGTYRTGAIIYVQVVFNDTIVVTGYPTLLLEAGPVDYPAAYYSGTGSSTLTFRYTVQNGDVSPDLDVTGTNALSLNGGTINDPAGNPANLMVPQPGGVGSLGYNKNLIIDAERPRVVNVTSSKPNGVYKAGEGISINVRFHEPVVVTGTPQLELETGAVDRNANYASGSGTDTLAFAYTVVGGDSVADLDYKSTGSLLPSGGTIKDVPGNTATLTLPPPGASSSLGFNKEIVLIAGDGSIRSAKQQSIGSTVTLGDKVLYLKQTGFGYIEEQDRTCAIRIEGTFDASADNLVCLRGVLRETEGGELYLDTDLATTHGSGSIDPFGANNRFLASGLIDGLYVTAWGEVLAAPIGNSFFISDGFDATGIKVIVEGTPGVSAGDYVIIRGAAGFDNGRVIYKR